MKLTKSLRAVILKQFKQGDDMEYLAKLYGFTTERIEQVIRDKMIEIDNQHAAARNPENERKDNGEGNKSCSDQ